MSRPFIVLVLVLDPVGVKQATWVRVRDCLMGTFLNPLQGKLADGGVSGVIH